MEKKENPTVKENKSNNKMMIDAIIKRSKKLMYFATENLKRSTIIFVVSIVMSSFSTMMIPFIDFQGSTAQKIMAYSSSAFFWICLIIAYLLLFAINIARRQNVVNLSGDNRKKNRYGILNFGTCKEALIIDIILTVSFVLFVISLFIHSLPEAVLFFLFSTLIFSLNMHGFLNGENYVYIKRNIKK